MEGGWWKVVGGRWLVEGGWWKVVGGRWLVEGGWWKVVGGKWLVEIVEDDSVTMRMRIIDVSWKYRAVNNTIEHASTQYVE